MLMFAWNFTSEEVRNLSHFVFLLKENKATNFAAFFVLWTEANPHKFTSRWFNLLQYVEAGSKDFIKKTWKDLKDYIQLEVTLI